MKMSKRIFASALAIIMLFALAACGGNGPAVSSAPSNADEPEVIPAEPPVETPAPVETGIYYFAYRDIYGDISNFSVRLNEDGSFDMMTLGPIGVLNVSGTGWTDNGDGSFTTGATSEVIDVEFVGADGSATWTLLDEDNNVVPVGYTEPIEFEERPAAGPEGSGELPENVFKYKETAFLPTDWTLELLEDGTYKLSETNDLVGTQEYAGETWTREGDVVTCGPLVGNRPGVDNWATGAEGFVLQLGEGTFKPVG